MTTPPSESDSSTRPLRVLHLYAGNLFGGVERFLLNLVRWQSMTPTVEHQIALCFEGRLAMELRAIGTEPIMLTEVRFSRPWTVWRARKLLRDLVARARFDLAATHSGWLHALFAPVLRQTGTSCVFFAHTPPSRRSWLDRRAAKFRPTQVIANSRFTADAAKKVFPGVSVDHVYLPADIAPPDGASGSIRVGGTIAIAARFERLKGHDVLLKALALIPASIDWTCKIAGDAQSDEERAYVHELQSMARKLEISNRVEFVGHQANIGAFLSDVTVLCQPNTGPEAFGLIFIEAMGRGVPVVTSNIGSAPEIFGDASCGRLCQPDDAPAVTRALVEILSDSTLRETLSRTARGRAWEISNPRARMAELESAFRKAVHGGSI